MLTGDSKGSCQKKLSAPQMTYTPESSPKATSPQFVFPSALTPTSSPNTIAKFHRNNDGSASPNPYLDNTQWKNPHQDQMPRTPQHGRHSVAVMPPVDGNPVTPSALRVSNPNLFVNSQTNN